MIWYRYKSELSNWADVNGVVLADYPDHVEHSNHLFFLRFSNLDTRNRFINYMKAAGVATPFHYQALHVAPFAKRFNPDNCPNSLIASDTLVRLPIYFSLTPDQQEFVINKVKNFV